MPYEYIAISDGDVNAALWSVGILFIVIFIFMLKWMNRGGN